MRRLHLGLCIVPLFFSLASCGRPSEQATLSGRYPNAPVIVISVDTLRADHLPAYGYRGVATPNLDSLRRDSLMFANAYSHCPLTLPSHATMLLGTLPYVNGVRDNIGYTLKPGSTDLMHVLKALGYQSGAAVSAYVLRGETGLRRLFDWYDDAIPFQPGMAAGAIQRPGSRTIESALQWIRPRREKPFFFLLHLFEPHTPYEPPEPFRSASSSAYDGEIAYTDSLVGRFLDELRREGIYERAIIILLSDHGEGLGDHGEREHGIFLYREALHVPLMIKLPGGKGRGQKIDDVAGLIDIAPTVAALVGAAVPAGWQGVALTWGETGKAAKPRRIYGESAYGRLHLGWSEIRSLIDERNHFIEAPRPELYDLTRDPKEKQNILADNRRLYAELRRDMAMVPHELNAPAIINSEERDKLAALGYLTGSSGEAPTLTDPKDGIAELSLYEEAKALMSRRDYDGAIEAYRRLLQKNPRFTDARTQLATIYEATGRYAEAETTYRELLRQNPASAEHVAIALGVVYLNLGRYDEAESHAALALRSNPGGTNLLLGRVRIARGDYPGAERHAREAAGDSHYRSAAVLLLAEALVRQRKVDRALEVLDAEKEELRRANSAMVRSVELGRGDALMRLGRVGDADAAFREEIRLFPDNRDAYTALAYIYATQGKRGEIERLLEGLVAASPTRANYALAAKTLEAFGLPAAAVEWRRRAGVAGR
ncbi:MAG TPA: sulfatase-like hydrolase/transferase [Thermoanaerobaculia bacterium]|nr:sulfatase-like hydrolase/transferase [Thermoanaerobaculia bacterium]